MAPRLTSFPPVGPSSSHQDRVDRTDELDGSPEFWTGQTALQLQKHFQTKTRLSKIACCLAFSKITVGANHMVCRCQTELLGALNALFGPSGSLATYTSETRCCLALKTPLLPYLAGSLRRGRPDWQGELPVLKLTSPSCVMA